MKSSLPLHYGLNVCALLPQFYVEALTLSVSVFRDETSKEVIKVKRGHKGGAPTPQDWCPYRKGAQGTRSLSLSTCAQRIGHVST